jgi:hypothetical protein
MSRIRVGFEDRHADGGRARERMLAVLRGEVPAAVVLPAELERLADAPIRDVTAYRWSILARALSAQQVFDRRLVRLTPMDDAGEDALTGRWVERPDRWSDLREWLNDGSATAVLVGPPGIGKSVQLKTLEADLAAEGLGSGDDGTIPFRVHLSDVHPAGDGRAQRPMEWLSARWSERFGALPSLETMLGAHRMVLLLDGLNEIPAASVDDRRRIVERWARFADAFAERRPGNRAVFASRSTDHDHASWWPRRSVLLIRAEPLDDPRIEAFLERFAPDARSLLPPAPERAPLFEVLSTPFFLQLFAESASRYEPEQFGRAGLIATVMRRSIVRELAKGGQLLRSPLLLDRDDLGRLLRGDWAKATDLPVAGVLVPGLATLAHRMLGGDGAQPHVDVRIRRGEALRVLDDPRAELILEGGVALGILRYRRDRDQLKFAHQLVQECLAGLAYLTNPDPSVARVEWRAEHTSPSLPEQLTALAPAESLPLLAPTGWEESIKLAADLSDDPEGIVRGLLSHNVALAAGCAAQASVRPRVSDALLDELRGALVERSGDMRADLRDRIACGAVLGELGDPRFEILEGADGPYLWPPFTEIPASTYPIGDDEPIEYRAAGDHGVARHHIPRHEVTLEAFTIGCFPVTNAEWACFIQAGGYEDERWWEGNDARGWRRGDLTDEGMKVNSQLWRSNFQADPELLGRMIEEGQFSSPEIAERWRRWMAMDDAEFEATMAAKWGGGARPSRPCGPIGGSMNPRSRSSASAGTRRARIAPG